MTPHACPVCAGRGVVPPGFYTFGLASSTAPETCRACQGSGVLWETEAVIGGYDARPSRYFYVPPKEVAP